MSRPRGSRQCPVCSKYVSLKADGKFYRHGPRNSCRGATDYVVVSSDSPRGREAVSELQRLWRIGDALAASDLTGIPYPDPVVPESMDVDTELAFLIDDARAFISDIAARIGAKQMA